ncbi:hypothetical protein NSK_004284 [Nannochloropsis salina CCMP1776]|uniref:t-SNARE coiled-coil homology domain-containing protein n=1 Tax=Nannochloropsis salina CCMP1776 TaxID=1027361 RepID=A0A4D9D2P6_9STRA|nr:hypothetical protein NSK_004284 [Nannochloropsis salina CCMP1776]|eukprot:TFJ84293.1 hypothetical protein NSK_004284 [Nannochloropsis salina CCMP1776]
MSFQDVASHSHSYENGGMNGGVGYGNGGALTSKPVVTFGESNGRSIYASGSRSATNGSTDHTPGSSVPPLRHALLQYQQQVQLFEKLSRVLGGPRDDSELRSQLQAQGSVVKEVGSRVEQLVHVQLRTVEGVRSKAEKDKARLEVQKMSKDAQRLKLRFENLERAAAVRLRELKLAGRRAEDLLRGSGIGNGDEPGAGRGGQLIERQHGQQEMQLLQAEDLDERLLQEREEEIVAINQSVVKVNEIFRDLGELVSRQQEDIDAIEQNVQHSHAAAKSGLEQVAKAAKYQAGCSLS